MTESPVPLPPARASAFAVRASTLLMGVCLLGTLLVGACGDDEAARAMDEYVAFVEPRLDGEQAVWGKIASWSERRQQGERVDPPAYYDFLEREAVPFYDQLVKDLVSDEPTLPELRAAHRELVQFAQYRLEFVRTEQRLGDTFREGGQLLRELAEAEMEAEQTRRDYDRASTGSNPFDGRYTRISLMWVDFHKVYLVRCLEGDITIAELRQRIVEHVLVKLVKMRHSRFADNDHAKLLRRVVVTSIEYFEALDAALEVFIPSKRAAVYSDDQIVAGEKALRAFQKGLQAARTK